MIKVFLGNIIISCAKLLMTKLAKHINRATYKNPISLTSVFVFYFLGKFIIPQKFTFFYHPKFLWNLRNLEKIDLTIDTIRKISFIITIFMLDSLVILTVPREFFNVRSVSFSLKVISIVYDSLFKEMQILDNKVNPIANQIENPTTNYIENHITEEKNNAIKTLTLKI